MKDNLPSIDALIADFNAQFDDMMIGFKSMIETDELNVAAAKAHGTGNEAIINDLSVMITNLKCLAIVFSIRYRNKANTSMEDCNNAIKLQKFAQTLEDMRKYYDDRK